MEWFNKIRLQLRCSWIRYKHKDELYTLVFSGRSYPSLGEILTDTNGIKLMVVSEGVQEGEGWAIKAFVIEVPHESFVDLDFISPELPNGSLVYMHHVLWEKIDKGHFVIREFREPIRA